MATQTLTQVNPLDQVNALRTKFGIPRKTYPALTKKDLRKVVSNAVGLMSFDFDSRSFYVAPGTEHMQDEAIRYFNKWREYGTTEPMMVKIQVTNKVSRIIVRSK